MRVITPSREAGHCGGCAGPQAATAAAPREGQRTFPRVRLAFLGDASWWAAGLLGLVADVSLRLAAPGALSGSVLIGAAEWLSCVLLQPVIEESVFRGILQGELLRTRWGRRRICQVSAANAVCSMGFAAVHFVHHPPLWAASVLVPSLIFGWLRERHGTVASPIGMHILYNLEFFSAASLAVF